MSNLAYKKYDYEIEFEEPVKDTTIDQSREEKIKSLKLFMGMISYGIILLVVGVIYVNCIMVKTQYNMKMADLKQKKNKILIELNKIKADTDIKVDFRKIEVTAKDKLQMEIADEIKYVRFK